jgi:hypothetical protein
MTFYFPPGLSFYMIIVHVYFRLQWEGGLYFSSIVTCVARHRHDKHLAWARSTIGRIDLKGFWRWCMLYRTIWLLLDSVHRLVCGSFTKNHNVSETGSVSILRWMEQGRPLSWAHQKELVSITGRMFIIRSWATRYLVNSRLLGHATIEQRYYETHS